jgi:hypothetical protein
MYRLYAYADSVDLAEHENTLVAAFTEFASKWQVCDVLLTNRRLPHQSEVDLPDWNIGLRVNSKVLTREHVAQLLDFLSSLSCQVSLPFVVGTWRLRQIGTTDLCVVDRKIPDKAVERILNGAIER